MKIPKYILRVGGLSFVIAKKEGLGAIAELLADALPVSVDLRANPPEIELDSFSDDPEMIRYLTQVTCTPIPPNVVWKRKSRTGEVEIVRPVEKAPKALKAPRAKALPAPKQKALPPPTPQLTFL